MLLRAFPTGSMRAVTISKKWRALGGRRVGMLARDSAEFACAGRRSGRAFGH